MDSFEVGGKQYQVVVTHLEGRAEIGIVCDRGEIATLMLDERGISSVVMEQCLVVARR